MSDRLRATGYLFYPLRDMDDGADLMEAASLVPPAAPRRADRIIEILYLAGRSIVLNSFQLLHLITGVRDGDSNIGVRFEALVSRIPPRDKQLIVTARTECIVCDGKLEEPYNDKGKRYFSNPQLFTRDGKQFGCELQWLRCKHCKARHYFSYAIGGDLLPEGEMQVRTQRLEHALETQTLETQSLVHTLARD